MASKKQQRKPAEPRASQAGATSVQSAGRPSPSIGVMASARETDGGFAAPEKSEAEMVAGLERAQQLLRTAQRKQTEAEAAEKDMLYAHSRANAMTQAAETEKAQAQAVADGARDALMRRAKGMAKAAQTEEALAKRAELEKNWAMDEAAAARAAADAAGGDLTHEPSSRPTRFVTPDGDGDGGDFDPGRHKPVPPTGRDGGPTPSYPILTEELGYPPSPVGGGSATGGGSSGGYSDRSSSMGATVTKALQDVLSWKPNSRDAAGFVGALNQSFSLTTVEGTVVSKWTPRSYAVQTDLAGGVSGAQASIYTMAKTLLDQMLPLLGGLTALDPSADEETVAALTALITDQMTNLTNEIGNVGGPRVMRVHQYFQMLLGVKIQLQLQPPARIEVQGLRQLPERIQELSDRSPQPFHYWKYPDSVLGSLGDLRDQLGLFEFGEDPFVNTVADEQNVTNFRVLVDYINSLLGAWSNSIRFFAGMQTPFLGTQLVIISRQLGVISETVDEVRFVLDSVFVGPAQRSTLLLDFRPLAHHTLHVSNRSDGQRAKIPAGIFDSLPPIYLEDLLGWIQDFVASEAKNVIQNGGKLGIGEDFKVMIAQLYTQAFGLYLLAQRLPPAGGMSTTRVQQSLYKLADQLGDLFAAAAPVGVDYIRAGH